MLASPIQISKRDPYAVHYKLDPANGKDAVAPLCTASLNVCEVLQIPLL